MTYASNIGILGFRAPDGTGNNVGGQAFSEYLRITPNSYVDGKSVMLLPHKPVGPFAPNLVGLTSYDGPAARPRDISDAILKQPKDAFGNDIETPNAFGVNENFQFFGQFLTHDMAEGALGTARAAGKANAPAGAPNVDTIAIDGLPFPFTRVDANIDADGVRQQVSEETSFLDLSQVYGSNQAMLDLLRDNNDTAKLVVHQGNMLPTVADVAANSGLSVTAATGILRLGGFGGATANPDAYATGDQRANQTPMLLTYHTVMVREHNRLVDELRDKHPDWTSDQVFNAARALNEAQWQSIVYHEYLPKLLGSGALDPYSGYKSDVNPGAGNEWATVAFRFGHDQSSNTNLRINEDGSNAAIVKLGNAFALSGTNTAFGSSNSTGDTLTQGLQLDEYMRGLTQRVTQEIDGKVADGNRNALFGITLPDGTPVTVDLEAFDIQRGRDQGVGNLNHLREGLGLKAYTNVDQFVGQNNAGNALGQAARAALKSVYGNDINAVDSVVAGLLEKNVKGSMLGETFHLLTVDQFERTRDGDKQFYLNQFKDNPNLIKEIEGTSFAELIMRNTDTTVYHDAFLTYNRTTGIGGAGRDLVLGSKAADIRSGGAGDDDLYGFEGNDGLSGGDGNDLINGGLGDDALTGNKGNDTFVFQGACGKDTITDFEKGKDRIDLSDYYLTFADVQAHAKASGTDVTIDVGAAHGGVAGIATVTLANAKLAQMDASYFLFF